MVRRLLGTRQRSAERRGAIAPGLVGVAALSAAAIALGSMASWASGLVIAMLLGVVWANTIGIRSSHVAGCKFASSTLLRVGIVALGLRLGLRDVLALGGPGMAMVSGTVIATFFGTRWAGHRLGLDRDLSLLVATGYSICSASAIAAVAPNTDASEDHVAASIGLVTLFGTVAVFVVPSLCAVVGLDNEASGLWIGSSTHDVAQVVAAASSVGSAAVSAAIVVKLTRVALLAPLVAGISVARRRAHGDRGDPSASTEVKRPPVLPMFVVGFLVAVAVRTTGVLSPQALDVGGLTERAMLSAGMVGLGTGVDFERLRRLSLTPLLLGSIAWLLVASVSLGGVLVVA